MWTKNGVNVYRKSPALAREWAGPTTNEPGPAGPPGWLLDRLAEESITGKYDTSADNLCDQCFQYASANGLCGCPD